MRPAVDGKGKKIGDEWWSNEAVDAALDEYKVACSHAQNAVVEVLQELSRKLQSLLPAIVAASNFGIICKALELHVRYDCKL